jgi:hypothetical protein
MIASRSRAKPVRRLVAFMAGSRRAMTTAYAVRVSR